MQSFHCQLFNSEFLVEAENGDTSLLLGEFGHREKVEAIHEFIAAALREPFREFSLTFLNAPLVGQGDAGGGVGVGEAAGVRAGGTMAGGRPGSAAAAAAAATLSRGRGYALAGTIEGAGLAPSALVHFKWTDTAALGQNTDGLAQVLTDALMAGAMPLE